MKKFVNHCALVIFAFYLLSSNFMFSAGHIVLEHPLVNFIDKLMSSGEYGVILQIRSEVRQRLFGVPTRDGSGSRIGMFDYKGDKYSLVQLVKIEGKCEKEYKTRKTELISNPAQLEALEQEYKETKRVLREVLEVAKNDFIEISKDYIEAARGTKEQVLFLIKESSEKRGIKDCFLLKWGETEEGHETIYLENDIVTLKGFARFCYDLTNFLEDMARSMPRAKKKFLSLVEKSK